MKLFFLLIAAALFFVACGEDCEFKAITTDELPEATVGEEYSASITYYITCSYTAKHMEIIEGSLPRGLTMDGSGAVTGTPENAGEYPFTVKVMMCFGSGYAEPTDCSELTKEIKIVVVEP